MKNIYIIIAYCICVICTLAVIISDGKAQQSQIFILGVATFSVIYLVRRNNKMKK